VGGRFRLLIYSNPVKISAAGRALLATLLLRIACSLFAYRFGEQIQPNSFLASKNGLSAHLLGPADGWRYLIYGIWDRFDTLWYLHIAAHGYDRAAATVFYPLYPLLIRCLAWLWVEPTVAALIVSTISTFFLLWGLQKLAQLDWPGTEVWAMALFTIWPASFIFMAGYPDSLVIALVVWSVYSARKDRWWLAGCLACVAGLTKAAGVLAAVPLAVLLLRNRRWNRIPALALAPIGVIGYTIWLKLDGFPPASEVYATYWSTQVAMPWRTFLDAFPPVLQGDWLIGLNLAALLFSLAALVTAKDLPLDYTLFSAACLTLFLTKHTDPILQSTPRYILLAFPVFLSWARWIKRRTSGLLILMLLCVLYFGMLRTFLWWGLIA
jgi:hypothetical protein